MSRSAPRKAALSALCAGALLAGTGASPAAASGATIQPGRTAHVSADGWSVRWSARITCPAGEAFEVDLSLHDISNDSPYDDGGDYGVPAFVDGPEAVGTCTGSSQRLRFSLPVRESRGSFPDPDDPEGPWIERSGMWAMEPGGSIDSFISLSGDGFSTFQCQAAACADVTLPWKVRLR